METQEDDTIPGPNHLCIIQEPWLVLFSNPFLLFLHQQLFVSCFIPSKGGSMVCPGWSDCPSSSTPHIHRFRSPGTGAHPWQTPATSALRQRWNSRIKNSLACKRAWSDGGIFFFFFFPLFQQGAYYTQPVYAAQPHVIHHTTVVQPNSIPSAIYPAPVAAPRTNGVAMGMVAGTTMAMSAGKQGTLPVL